ncbi:hypothetical protein GFL49_28900 [Rhizobium leguminosarum bv. viciae]|nr:hypothetical protein [Rhizobium leguminosarum bv. viciae]
MMYRQQQDATAINLRMGSGGRLTSRRCHEITWPSSGRRPQVREQQSPISTEMILLGLQRQGK